MKNTTRKILASLILLPALCSNSPAPGPSYDYLDSEFTYKATENPDEYEITVENDAADKRYITDINLRAEGVEAPDVSILSQDWNEDSLILIAPGKSYTSTVTLSVDPSLYTCKIEAFSAGYVAIDAMESIDSSHIEFDGENSTVTLEGSVHNTADTVSYWVGLGVYTDYGYIFYPGKEDYDIGSGKTDDNVKITATIPGEMTLDDFTVVVIGDAPYYDDLYINNSAPYNLGDHPGLIAGIVLASIFLAALVVGIIVYVVRLKKNKGFTYHKRNQDE